jgi:predicted Zn-dependent peptidase
MIEKFTLDNGLRVMVEDIPYVRSVTAGVWVETGSRNETEENNGISHYLEHMAFKGTQQRSAEDIAKDMDKIGGQINAFTAKECTCYHAKVLDCHMEEALEVLSDIYRNAAFRPEDVETERGIIQEEINMNEDSPEDLCIDCLHEAMWKGSTLAYPILGTQESLERITPDTLRQYRDTHYTPKNTVISVAGRVDKGQLEKMVEKYFGTMAGESKPWQKEQPVYTPTYLFKEKEIEQNHLAIAFPGVELLNPDSYSVSVLSNILGGAMSSRLFQQVREKRGLAYSIYAFSTCYRDAGALTIYAGLSPQSQKQVMDIIRREVEDICAHGVTDEEFLRGREQIKTNLIMGYESMSNRMSSMARGEIFRGRAMTLEETMARMDALTREDVDRVAKNILDWNQKSICLVGTSQEGME